MLDPFMLLKWPYLWWVWWTRKLGVKTVVTGMVLVTVVVCLYGWYETWA